MELVPALREASDFYAKERPRASLCELQTEIGQIECEGIARRFDGAADEIARLRAALDRIAFCGAGEDYRELREIARKALETPSTSTSAT